MKKLVLVLLAFLAVFTYIRAFEKVEASDASQGVPAEITVEIPVEIIR